MITFLQLNESHPPFYYLLFRGWTAIWGHSPAAIRTLPFLFSVALIPSVYVVARRMFSAKVGATSAILVALAPMLAYMSVQVRPYSLLTLLAVWATFALWCALGTNRWLAWAAYVLAATAMVWTHNWAWVYLAAHGIGVALCLVDTTSRVPAAKLRRLAFAWGAIGVLFAPWFESLLFQAAHAGHPQRTIGALEPLRQLIYWSIGTPTPVAEVGYILLLAVLVKAIPAAADANRRRAVILFGLMPGCAMLVAKILSIRSDLIVGQCIVTLTPFVMIGCASGMSALRKLNRIAGALVAGGLVAVVGLTAGTLVNVAKSNAHELAVGVAQNDAPTDVVIVVPEPLGSAFSYYYESKSTQFGFPSMRRPDAISFADYRVRMSDDHALQAAEDTLKRAHDRSARVWLVVDAQALRDSALFRSRMRDVDRNGFGTIGLLRANQLRRYLRQLYGEPLMELPSREPYSMERMHATLFGRAAAR